MKVTLINISDAGGGAPAAGMRLLKALEQKPADVQMLVQEKKTGDVRVTSVSKGYFGRLRANFNFFYERLPFIWFRAKTRAVRFAFSPANIGTDISRQEVVADADVLHLHWTNGGFLSIDNIKKLLQTGKPVVWTLHDMWTFTGGCSYSSDCDHFLNECGNCWMLRAANENDLSHCGWLKKLDLYKSAKNIVFITCSTWLSGVAKTSSLLRDFRIEAIPNPIDTEVFSPKDKGMLRQKWGVDLNQKIILFGAANILDWRKGITYLVEALKELKLNYTESGDVGIVIFGKNKSFDVNMLPFKAYEMNIIRSERDMAELYSLADVYVAPTIQDNLPNTVMEALACGTPVVAFNTGGLPDMVDHLHNGYLAEYKSSVDFAAGINYVLTSNKKNELAINARKKVLDNFTNDIVAEKYLAIYQSILQK